MVLNGFSQLSDEQKSFPSVHFVAQPAGVPPEEYLDASPGVLPEESLVELVAAPETYLGVNFEEFQVGFPVVHLVVPPGVYLGVLPGAKLAAYLGALPGAKLVACLGVLPGVYLVGCPV